MWEGLNAPTKIMARSVHPDGSGYAALRRNRYSAPGAEYFLTFNLQQRGDHLSLSTLYGSIRDEVQRLEKTGLWILRTMVVMPDHLHLLVILGHDAGLASTVRLFKERLAPALRRDGMSWQDGYYDRKLRENDDRVAVFLYIFLNPYRARLITREAKWPSYHCHEKDWKWFGAMTAKDRPIPEWLA